MRSLHKMLSLYCACHLRSRLNFHDFSYMVPGSNHRFYASICFAEHLGVTQCIQFQQTSCARLRENESSRDSQQYSSFAIIRLYCFQIPRRSNVLQPNNYTSLPSRAQHFRKVSRYIKIGHPVLSLFVILLRTVSFSSLSSPFSLSFRIPPLSPRERRCDSKIAGRLTS